MRILDFVFRSSRWMFHYGTKPLTKNEKEGLSIAVRQMLRHPGQLSLMLVTGLVAAVFEGGTIGLLGLAVKVLTDESVQIVQNLPSFLNDQLALYLLNISQGGLFLLLIGLAVSAQILKGLLGYVSTVAQTGLSYRLMKDGQDGATNHVMNMSYRQVSQYPSGQLGSLIDQSGVLSDIVTEVGKASRAILMTVSYVSVMILISPLLTAAAIVVFGLLWVALSRIVKILKQLSTRAVEGEIDTWRWSIEYLNVPRLLRLFGTTDIAKGVIQDARHKRIAAEKKSAVINAAILPAFEIITVFGAGVFLICGYLFSGESAIKVVPGLFVFVLVFFRLKPQVKLLNDLRIQMAKLLPKLGKVGEFLRTDDKEFEKIGGVQFRKLTSSIQVRGVSYRYDGADVNAVSSLDFDLARGETIALVGESGSGKSTIVNLLVDLHQPSVGEILIDGNNLNTIDSITWREKIGIVDQEVYLLNTSIKDNISFGRQQISDLDIETAARTALAHDFIKSFEDGYHTVVGDRGYRLSGGEQQRIALARALVGNPDILILDEATSSLDTISEKYIQRAIEGMHDSRTILVIAHRLSTVTKADKILVLDAGKIVESGTKDELLTEDGIFSKLWATQYR